MKVGTVTSEQQLTIDRAISRDLELQAGRVNHKRVHKSKKTYCRKRSQNKSWV